LYFLKGGEGKSLTSPQCLYSPPLIPTICSPSCGKTATQKSRESGFLKKKDLSDFSLMFLHLLDFSPIPSSNGLFGIAVQFLALSERATKIAAQLPQKMLCSSATKRNYTAQLALQKEIDLINKAKLLNS